MSRPLVIIPTYMREQNDLLVLCDCLRSLRDTEGDRFDILVVDDGSPQAALVDAMESLNDRWNFEVHRKPENDGFSATVNIGLQRCLDDGRDAILCNADIEAMHTGWLDQMTECKDQEGNPAAVVGALLIYANGLIQHAGVYFSLLTREFNHLYKYAPMNLPEANEISVCPVTGAFQFIRHSTLVDIGLYDETFKLGYEDMDYCIRTMLAGKDCVYNPLVRAYHYESMFRGRSNDKIAAMHTQSYWRLAEKYREQSFAGLVPFL